MSEPIISLPECETQKRVIRFFKEDLRYDYLGNLADVPNKNVRENDLRRFLVDFKHYSEVVANKAVASLVHTAGDMQQGLYAANKNVYGALKYPNRIQDENGENQSVYFIDFENPSNNTFAVAEEVTVNTGLLTKRPDLVVYVNGIALAVIELKKSTISVADGIRQNLTNQSDGYIRPFFSTVQFCCAGNESEGLRYGTVETPETKFAMWKEEAFRERLDELDDNDLLIDEKNQSISGILFRGLFSLFNKTRFLDLIHNFVIFDLGKKKVCRYNQYYAIHRAYNRIKKQRKGGIIWHTQGSGKSLTMVWLSKRLLLNEPERRILIVTDREELDSQIYDLFLGVDEKIYRMKSGADLIRQLNSKEHLIVCSLVHKFGHRSGEVTEGDYRQYLEELKKSLPENFRIKGDLVVFVDECHRTQSGLLHRAMQAILPDAVFVGFTGTPLLKKDKQTSIEVFGSYIHAYKFNEGVRDKVILDLHYEGRDVPQELKSREKIDAWFDLKTAGLTPVAKAKLKTRWANMRTVYSSRNCLQIVVEDIILDFEQDARLCSGHGNAILIADSIYTACKYYEIFQQNGFKKCAIISSYMPSADDLRTDTVSLDEDTETFEKYQIYRKMVGIEDGEEPSRMQKKVEAFEKEAKRRFVEEPANMKLLIVVDKLLTGFDAPHCTYLYIDKKMQDHGLFQAICRVNRLDDETKPFGIIVDYKGLFNDVADSMNQYTSGAFENYDESDVAGLIKNRTAEAVKCFDETLEKLETLCEDVPVPKGKLEYQHYFCGESGNWITDQDLAEAKARLRERLYLLAGQLMRALGELKAQASLLDFTQEEWVKKEAKSTFYYNLREEIQKASADYIDLKAYEPGMRYLIDNYIVSGESQRIGGFDEASLLQVIELLSGDLNSTDKIKGRSAAEKIENNIRRKIVAQISVNPAYYHKMSQVLDELIRMRKQGVLEYAELLKKYMELARNVNQPDDEKYSEKIRESGALKAIYDNCGNDEQLALKIHAAVLNSKQEDFRNNPVKANKIKRALYEILQDDAEVSRLYDLICRQAEY